MLVGLLTGWRHKPYPDEPFDFYVNQVRNATPNSTSVPWRMELVKK
jgi:hypothetical protein